MTQTAGRIAGGLVLLVTLWIGVYWWWPSAPPVTYAQNEEAIRGVKPTEVPSNVRVPAAPVAGPGPVRQEPVPQPRPTLPPERVPEPRRVEAEPALPAPQPQAVVPPEFINHTVVKGESFESIARKYYGVSGKGSIIAKANPLTDPTRLQPGRVVLVPKNPSNIQGVPAPRQEPQQPSAEEEYTVQEGDTLSKIAQEVYGESRLWTIIRDANRDRLASESSLKIGQKLRIPPKPKR